ncbi:MAG TPA: hypothetical protein PJ988_12015 [Anaerolinea sp.]|nr:hypothetical protein [Anaerolinea sp.]
MKPVKIGLRVWFAITSLLSFLFGWALFSHAQKPASLFTTQSASAAQSSVDPLPTLQPIPSLNDLTSGGLQALPAQPSLTTRSMPRMRLGGS